MVTTQGHLTTLHKIKKNCYISDKQLIFRIKKKFIPTDQLTTKIVRRSNLNLSPMILLVEDLVQCPRAKDFKKLPTKGHDY